MSTSTSNPYYIYFQWLFPNLQTLSSFNTPRLYLEGESSKFQNPKYLRHQQQPSSDVN